MFIFLQGDTPCFSFYLSYEQGASSEGYGLIYSHSRTVFRLAVLSAMESLVF